MAAEIHSSNRSRPQIIELTQQENGDFYGVDTEGRAGDLYKFRLNDSDSFPDPLSRWQPEGVHGPSMVIDPTTYVWRDRDWKTPPLRDLVIYEIHVGTFTPEGTFHAVIDKLEHLRRIGVNAIELMPIGDFAGARNWGYDGVYLYAPARVYGHPDSLRALVDAAHRQGIAVILDVVYNHFGPDGNYLHAYLGDYLDESQKTPWGGAIRFSHPDFKPLRDAVVANPAYWMREFHIDGFRLDATHAIHDDSSRHILQEITASIHARGGFAIAEDERNDARLITCEAESGFGFDAVWADDFHHIIRVCNTQEKEGYLGDFRGTPGEAVDVLRHGWLYRGQETLSSKQVRGTECSHLPPQSFIHCISNHDQTGNHAFGERLAHRIHPNALRATQTLLCLSPYTPLLFMGQEWAASTPFLFFTDHTPELGRLILEGRRDEFKHFAAFRDPEALEKIPDPQLTRSFHASKLVWEECQRDRHAQTLALYEACLKLRNNHAAFRPDDRVAWRVEQLEMGAIALHYHDVEYDWCLLFDLTGGHEGYLGDEPIIKSARGSWEVVLWSNELRFGGTGACAIDPSNWQAKFVAAEAVVLRERPV